MRLDLTMIASVPPWIRPWLTLIVTTLIIVLSITPGDALPNDNAFVWLIAITPHDLQKLMHIVAYATLAYLWMRTLESIDNRFIRIALTIIATVGLGAFLEWCQIHVAGRYGSILDVFLNTLGSLIGLAIARAHLGRVAA